MKKFLLGTLGVIAMAAPAVAADLPALRALLVPTPAGPQVPLGQLAQLSIQPGPPMIRSENAQTTAWVYVDITGRDLGG